MLVLGVHLVFVCVCFVFGVVNFVFEVCIWCCSAKGRLVGMPTRSRARRALRLLVYVLYMSSPILYCLLFK